MEFFRIKKDIPFMRHALVFNIISLVTFLMAVFFLATKGLHLSVEFTGGTLIEVSYSQSADLEKIRGALGKSGFSDYSVQNFGSSQDVMIRLPLRRSNCWAASGFTRLHRWSANTTTMSPAATAARRCVRAFHRGTTGFSAPA